MLLNNFVVVLKIALNRSITFQKLQTFGKFFCQSDDLYNAKTLDYQFDSQTFVHFYTPQYKSGYTFGFDFLDTFDILLYARHKFTK
jgi:hypothetical protein